MWWKPAYIRLLEDERQRLLKELVEERAKHQVEIQGFRRYIDQLLRRLFEKHQVPSPEPRLDEKLTNEPFDPFTDIEENLEDRVVNQELDEFVR